jgi:hypothetical protein
VIPASRLHPILGFHIVLTQELRGKPAIIYRMHCLFQALKVMAMELPAYLITANVYIARALF